VKNIKYLVDFAIPNIVKFQKRSSGRKNQLNFTHGPTIVATLVSKRPLLDKMKNNFNLEINL
jgi:hypothetical protein